MDPVAELKERFNGIDHEIKVAFHQIGEAERAERSAKRDMSYLFEDLHKALEVKYDVKIPLEEFKEFIVRYSTVMVIENGKVRFFDDEGELVDVGESAVKIYGRDWNSDYYGDEFFE